MNATQSVTVFGQLSSQLTVRDTKSGGHTALLLSKKEFGAAHNLKGAALNKAHFEYKRAAMEQNAQVVGAALMTGKIGLTRIGVNAKGNGGSLSFKTMDSLKAPKEKTPNLEKVDTSDLIAILEARGYVASVSEAPSQA